MREAFLASVVEPARADWLQVAELGPQLLSLWETAKAAWPTFAVSSEKFAMYLGDRAPAAASGCALQALHTTDLYLACACSVGAQNALVAFEKHCANEWNRGVARLSLTETDATELKQTLRTRLFVASTESGEQIRRYSGRGAIRAWYRTTVVRAAIDYRRASDRMEHNQALHELDEQVAFVDLELDYLKRNYRDEFKHCFHEALRSLTSEERNLLRYQLLEELSLAGLHLSSIARRLERLRERLLERTREHLQQRLGVDAGELDSIMRLIGSRLDVSISAVLGGAKE